MVLTLFYTLLAALFMSMGTDSTPLAQQSAPAGADQLQKELDRLEQEQMETFQKWRQSGQEHIPSLQSPLVRSEALSGSLPAECIEHLEHEKAKLEQGGYSKEAWLHHVFECEKCCAPLFADVMDIHVSYVIANPHLVILFDFDTDTVKDDYQQRLDTFMQQFDAQHDQLLLIGRASRIGHRGYNVALSGSRAVEIKDYVTRTFNLDDDRVRYLFFGADPPQLTLANAADYGITAEDIAAIDTRLRNRPENKINQSVVVIIHKDADDAVEPPTASPQVASADQTETRGLAPTTSEEVQGTQTAALSAPASADSPGQDGEKMEPLPVSDHLIVVTEDPTSTSFRFGLDVVRVGRDIGLDLELQQSKGGIDIVERLLNSRNAAIGVVASDMRGIMSQSSDAEMNRLSEQLHMLFPLYPEEVHLFADNEIQRIEDLAGKRVIVGVQGSRTWFTAHHLLRKFNVQPGEAINAVSPLKAIVAVGFAAQLMLCSMWEINRRYPLCACAIS